MQDVHGQGARTSPRCCQARLGGDGGGAGTMREEPLIDQTQLFALPHARSSLARAPAVSLLRPCGVLSSSHFDKCVCGETPCRGDCDDNPQPWEPPSCFDSSQCSGLLNHTSSPSTPHCSASTLVQVRFCCARRTCCALSTRIMANLTTMRRPVTPYRKHYIYALPPLAEPDIVDISSIASDIHFSLLIQPLL